MRTMRVSAFVAALAVGLLGLGATGVASADVTKKEAVASWSQDLCKTSFFYVEIRDMAFGDFTGDGRSDAVAIWTCWPPAGNLRMTGMTYWVDGCTITQRHVSLPMTDTTKVTIKGGEVKVVGEIFDPKPGQPYWADPAKAKEVFVWTGKRLTKK